MFTINGTNTIFINVGIYYQCNIPLFFLELVTNVQKIIKIGDHDKYATVDCVCMIFPSWNGLRYKTLKTG